MPLNFYKFCKQPEGIAIEAREALLRRAAQGTISFVMNKYDLLLQMNIFVITFLLMYFSLTFTFNRPPWMVETDPKELGLGIYL